MGKLSLDQLCGGALREKVNAAMEEVTKNILDPNTSADRKRKLLITMTFAPGENRDLVKTSVETKTTLAPSTGISTALVIGQDLQTGQVEYSEYNNQIRGQMSLKDMQPEMDSKEEKKAETKVVDLRKKA